MFCAPTATFEPSTAPMTVGSRTGEGNSAIWSRSWPATSGSKASTNALASAGVLYIFQLAAIRALRDMFGWILNSDSSGENTGDKSDHRHTWELIMERVAGRDRTRPVTRILLIRQRFHPRQFLALEKLERRASARGDVCNLIGHSGLVDGAYGVAAADDRRGSLVGRDSLGDGVRAHREARELEDASGAVPHDGAGRGDNLFNGRDRFGADVEALPIGREVL